MILQEIMYDKSLDAASHDERETIFSCMGPILKKKRYIEIAKTFKAFISDDIIQFRSNGNILGWVC